MSRYHRRQNREEIKVRERHDHIADNEIEATSLEPNFDETISVSNEDTLLEELEKTKRERDSAPEELIKKNKTGLTWKTIENDDNACKSLTGLSWEAFDMLYKYLIQFLPPIKTFSSCDYKDII